MLEQNMTISRYIYVDSDNDALACAQERVRELVTTKPHLFRKNSTRAAFNTWPTDINAITDDHLSALHLLPDESIIIIAGTPCQDFSTAGFQNGTAGTRGSITEKVAHILTTLQRRQLPVFFFLENVHPNIKNTSVM